MTHPIGTSPDFPAFFAVFSAKSMKEGAFMPRIIGRNLLLGRPSAHVDTRFCVTMRLEERARKNTMWPAPPKRDLSCPATVTKTMAPSGAGRTAPVANAARQREVRRGSLQRDQASGTLQANGTLQASGTLRANGTLQVSGTLRANGTLQVSEILPASASGPTATNVPSAVMMRARRGVSGAMIAAMTTAETVAHGS